MYFTDIFIYLDIYPYFHSWHFFGSIIVYMYLLVKATVIIESWCFHKFDVIRISLFSYWYYIIQYQSIDDSRRVFYPCLEQVHAYIGLVGMCFNWLWENVQTNLDFLWFFVCLLLLFIIFTDVFPSMDLQLFIIIESPILWSELTSTFN